MGIQFKLFLLKRGVKQFELADACGLQESKVSKFANGREVPKDREIALMAAALQVSEAKLRKEAGW